MKIFMIGTQRSGSNLLRLMEPIRLAQKVLHAGLLTLRFTIPTLTLFLDSPLPLRLL